MKTIIKIILILISSLFVHLIYSDWFNYEYAFTPDQFIKYPLLLIVFLLIPSFNKVYIKEKRKPNGKPKLIYPFSMGMPIALMMIIYQALTIDIKNYNIEINYIYTIVTLIVFYVIFYVFGTFQKKTK